METSEILKALCADAGVSGHEYEMYEIVKSMLPDCRVSRRENGTVVASMGNKGGRKIMFDAHIDRIGLIVTYINERGFLHCGNVGGMDIRALPGSAVTVHGRENIMAVICTKPPHLSSDKELDKNDIWADTGLPADKVKDIITLGDTVTVKSRLRELVGGRVSCAALDNRAGCAALIKCAQLLSGKELHEEVFFVFSSQEETNESGAKTAAFEIAPDEAVVVDVGFAKQDGVPSGKSGAMGEGLIITMAPVLSGKMTDDLISLCAKLKIGTDFEVDGGTTGTNADGISVTGGGVPCALVSIPVKNMHTQTETAALSDIEDCARLLAAYAMEGGVRNA